MNMTAKERMEQVGIVTKADVDALEAELINYMGADYAIIKIPVNRLEVDIKYHTEDRTDRSVSYLFNNFDRNKLMPITVVPHFEEGLYYIVDGFGRVITTQLIDRKNNTSEFKYIVAMVLLNAPEDPEERRKFEAELFAYQDRDVAKIKPIQRHGAKLILEDKATVTLEKMKEKYGFEYRDNGGRRPEGVIGSYTEALRICGIGEECADYVFNICKVTRFNTFSNGYSTYVLRALKDAYKYYPDIIAETQVLLCQKLRGMTPTHLKSFAVAKYPMLEHKAAVSYYIEDMIVEHLDKNHAREINGTKLRAIAQCNSSFKLLREENDYV